MLQKSTVKRCICLEHLLPYRILKAICEVVHIALASEVHMAVMLIFLMGINWELHVRGVSNVMLSVLGFVEIFQFKLVD